MIGGGSARGSRRSDRGRRLGVATGAGGRA